MAKEKQTKLEQAIKYYSDLIDSESATDTERGYATTAVYYLNRYRRYFKNKAESEKLMNDNRKWDEEEEAKLKEEFAKGHSVERLSKLHKRKISGIISRLVLLGLLSDEGASKRRWTKEEEDKLEKEFSSGKNLAKMAELHNRTIGGIYSRLLLLGLVDD